MAIESSFHNLELRMRLLIVEIVAERGDILCLAGEELRVLIKDLEAHCIEDLDLNIF